MMKIDSHLSSQTIETAVSRFSVTPYQMMNTVSFAQSMRVAFANSYSKDGPAEIIPGTGIMNYHLTDSNKE